MNMLRARLFFRSGQGLVLASRCLNIERQEEPNNSSRWYTIDRCRSLLYLARMADCPPLSCRRRWWDLLCMDNHRQSIRFSTASPAESTRAFTGPLGSSHSPFPDPPLPHATCHLRHSIVRVRQTPAMAIRPWHANCNAVQRLEAQSSFVHCGVVPDQR